MFFIPSQLISILTFPGVIVHEYAHHLFCKMTKTPVLEVCYFQFGNPSGYVLHERQNDLKKSLLIDIGPFLVNNAIGIILTFSSAIPVLKFSTGDALDWFFIWLGVSILMHSFPSHGDANALLKIVKETKGQYILKIACYPIIGLIYLGAIGSVIWLDFFYAVFIAIAFPDLIVKVLSLMM